MGLTVNIIGINLKIEYGEYAINGRRLTGARFSQGVWVPTLNRTLIYKTLSFAYQRSGRGASARISQGGLTVPTMILSPVGLMKYAIGADDAHVEATPGDGTTVALPCVQTYVAGPAHKVGCVALADEFVVPGMKFDWDAELKWTEGEIVNYAGTNYTATEDIYEIVARPAADLHFYKL